MIPPQFGGSLEKVYAVHEEYQAALRTVAADTNTPLLRTAEGLQQSRGPAFTDYDMVHPNAFGYELLGELLLEKLGALGWLPAPAS